MLNHILIIDDSPSDRRQLARLLTTEGFNVVEADCAEKGLETATANPPDLVVVDVEMPGMDGFELCTRLKGQLETSLVPVIFLSSHQDAENKAKGLELGGSDYITKPFESRETLARIRTQLQIAHLNNSLQSLNEDLLRLSNDLMDKQRALEEDLHAAARIQRTLIPSGAADLPGLDIGWSFVPCEDVGGDIFNFFRLDQDHLAFYIVDIAGHGVPSAMVTFSVAQALAPHVGMTVDHEKAGEVASPLEVLERLDREYPLERFDRPFTICYLVLNTRTGELVYSAAAHPASVLLRSDGSTELLDKGGPVIGMGDFLGFEQGQTQLHPGDRLFLYTDGITEQCDKEDTLFGDERFFELLKGPGHPSVQAICDEVVRAVKEFSGSGTPRDDLSLLAIEYRGGHDG